MRNIILFSSDKTGYNAALMPHPLKCSGLGVWIFCPETSIMRESNYIDGCTSFNIPSNITVLAQALADLIGRVEAKAIFPCDDLAFVVLNDIGARLREDAQSLPLKHLIATWIGENPALRLRSLLLNDARQLGVRTPQQIIIDRKNTEAAALGTLGSPLIVKCDYSCGGMGVILANNSNEALLSAQNIYETELSKHPEARVVAQNFIPGIAASVSFAAKSGIILDAFSYVTIKKAQDPFGASSVVTSLCRPDLIQIARRIVAMYAYSGFGGIDFILPDDGADPVFLEFNPRQTRTTHLGRLVGADLCGAMASALTGADYTACFGRGAAQTIALFPHEWQRDPLSSYLYQCHHDVPWYEPGVTSALLKMR